MNQLKSAVIVILFLLSCLAVVLYFSYPSSENMIPPQSTQLLDKLENESMIDFEIEDIDGKKFKLSDYKGKVIILNFWASWCDPCIEEIPSMLKLISQFNGDVMMVAISADYNMAELKKFLKVLKVESPYIKVVWDDTKSVSSKYLVEALPESFVIDKNFKLARKVPGSENWATEEAIEFFKQLVQQ